MSRATCFQSGMPVLLFAVMVLRGNALALEGSPPVAPEDVLDAGELDTLRSEAATNEDPDSARRAERQAITKAQSEAAQETAASSRPVEPGVEKQARWQIEPYGSARLHAINTFDEGGESHSSKLGDGASRLGLSALWHPGDWELFARAETGFDIIDSFTPKAQSKTDSGGKLNMRLLHIGVESEAFALHYGKSWSVYYKVAGAADRFDIFGGEAAGVYNAGTDGGATGTGRADNALQAELFMDLGERLDFKPFNINLQFQNGEPIPGVKGARYGDAYSVSSWLEHWNEFGIGLAWHRARISPRDQDPVTAAGIDGDARATAFALKSYGEDWLVSAVLSLIDNIETTNENRYINGKGAELYTQRRVHPRWWLTAGGNWLWPDRDDPDAGSYRLAYGVLGVRYTFDSFNRMLYAEWRLDNGRLVDGTRRGNEFTLGIRWDLGY